MLRQCLSNRRFRWKQAPSLISPICQSDYRESGSHLEPPFWRSRGASRQVSHDSRGGGAQRPFAFHCRPCNAAAVPPHAPRLSHQDPPRFFQSRSFGISRNPDPNLPDDERSLNAVAAGGLENVEGLKSDEEGGSVNSRNVLTADDIDAASGELLFDEEETLEMKRLMGELRSLEKEANDDNFDANLDANLDDSDEFDDPDQLDGSRGYGRSKMLTQEEHRAITEYQEQQKRIYKEIDNRTGRLWTESWTITDEEWMSTETWEEMEEWSPSLATRKSLESVKVFPGGVPTLEQLSTLSLPLPPPPHPGHGNPSVYAQHRKSHIQTTLQSTIQSMILPEIKSLLGSKWEEKQERIDILYETAPQRVREVQPVLGKLPNFDSMVEEALEEVLVKIQRRLKEVDDMDQLMVQLEKEQSGPGIDTKQDSKSNDDDNNNAKNTNADNNNNNDDQQVKNVVNLDSLLDVMDLNQEPRVPVFMDLLMASRKFKTNDTNNTDDTNVVVKPSDFFSASNDKGVPNLVYPLNVQHEDGVGRMVEEWQLAANKDTKRIMMRQPMQDVARAVVRAVNGEEDEKGLARVLVVGKRGVGKTATLAGIVASARVSGHIVIYLPDGDRLRKHAYYVEPSKHRSGLYDLPEIAKEFCSQLLTSHGDDISMDATVETMQEFLTKDQIARVRSLRKDLRGDDDDDESDDLESNDSAIALVDLLQIGSNSAPLSSGCYCSVISTLMNQTEIPLTVVMDEFNCYYDHGHFFHMDYDEKVKRAIPCNKITIFKPFLDAMGLYPAQAGTAMRDVDGVVNSTQSIQRGSIIAATSESRAVKGSFTEALVREAQESSDNDESASSPVCVVDVRRFGEEEVQHILYNFELTGIGRLRFDRGDTTLNPEEVAYLKMVSGGVGQPLLDACII